MQPQQGGGGSHDVRLGALGTERGRGEHARFQQARAVVEFEAHLSGARVGVEDIGDVADASAERLVGIGVEFHFGKVAGVNLTEIVLIDVAEHPNAREVGDGEQIWGIIGRFDAGGSGDVLLDDGARDGREQIDVGLQRFVVATQKLDSIECGLQIHFGFSFGILGGLHVLFRHRAL